MDAGRKVSNKVGESVAGIHEIQANGAFLIENKKFNRLVEHLRKIRIIWNLYRFAVKTVNSLFTNFSRFPVFALGGYLAINGRLELGALVAFLSAQEKLYDPWKELIQFYQAYQIASVTYSRTMEPSFFYPAQSIDRNRCNGKAYRVLTLTPHKSLIGFFLHLASPAPDPLLPGLRRALCV